MFKAYDSAFKHKEERTTVMELEVKRNLNCKVSSTQRPGRKEDVSIRPSVQVVSIPSTGFHSS